MVLDSRTHPGCLGYKKKKDSGQKIRKRDRPSSSHLGCCHSNQLGIFVQPVQLFSFFLLYSSSDWLEKESNAPFTYFLEAEAEGTILRTEPT